MPKGAYSHHQLVQALHHEYQLFIHDDYDASLDMTSAEHLAWLKTLTKDKLIEETDTGEYYTLEEFMHHHS